MFSVIIPAYNCEKTIYRTLDSVVKQTRIDLIAEIIIINDGSYDNTDIIIRDYITEHNSINFKYLKQQNRGVAYTRNYGIRIAVGKWIALLDSDDIWMPWKLERQYEEISRNTKIMFLGSDYPLKKGFKNYKQGLYKITAKELCIRNLPATPSVIFRKDVGIELGLYNEAMQYGEDINFFQKFLLKDSYYVMAEKLIEIGVGKSYFAESGLSSNLYRMHKGRDKNTIELYKMGLITKRYMFLMLAFNQVKLFRREMIHLAHRTAYGEGRHTEMFSVIIPAYNCENTISKSLDSIIRQTRKDLIKEVIIVNDGSTDSTDDVISRYRLEHSELYINYIKQDNHGVSHARNTGIMQAKAKWIALLDSDDIWLPNKIERQYEMLQELKSGKLE